MVAVASVLIIVLISLVVTRVATVALVTTGMSRSMARFQARSAFTGVGFTTNEAEAVVHHPARRRVVAFLMLVGNAGIVSVIAGVLLGFVDAEATATGRRAAFLLGGLVVIWLIASSTAIERLLTPVIKRALARFTMFEVGDHDALVDLDDRYTVAEMAVKADGWAAGRTLAQLGLPREGVLVLGIRRPDSTYVGTPDGETEVLAGDTMFVYGRADHIEDLDRRRRGVGGELAHTDAVAEHAVEVREQKAKDPAAATSDEPDRPQT